MAELLARRRGGDRVSYLSELDAELRRARVPGSQRRRVLAEARDHLLEAGAGGPKRFGDPRTLAAGFAADSASASARTATLALAAAVLVTLALWGAIALDVRSHPWLNDFPGALVAALAVQVAAVAAFVSLVRAVRYRGRAVPAARLPLRARTNAVAAVSLALGLAVTALAEANHLTPSRAGAWELAVAAGLGAACLLTLAAAAATARAAYRTQAVSQDGGEDIVDDLGALGTETLDRIPPRLAALVRRAVSSPWLDLRGHPWRFCATLATGFCLAIVAVGFVRGEPSPAVGVVEALAIVAGFAAFGRLFGLRR
jgi:hypothetical protein